MLLQREGGREHQKRQRRTIQLSMPTMCRSALTAPLAPVSVDLNSAPFSLNPKHSKAILVRRQIPLSAGPNLLVWCVEASGCSIWPQLSVRRDGICRDKTAEHKINEKSIFRKSQKYVRCLTSAAWIHDGQYFILSGCCKRLSYIRL